MSLSAQTEDFETGPPLHILHLEDNPHDREFVRRVLVKAGISCDFTYAASSDEFQTALKGQKNDLIISDFTLPGYSGSEALAFARKNYPDVPYLFVSGTIGEERAVESLKGGASDYVLTSNPTRLPGAVRSALREVRERKRRRQAERALRESEGRFREMAVNIRDVFWISSADGRRLIYASPGYETIWGRPGVSLHEEPSSWIDSIVPADRERALAAFDHLATGCEARVEYRIQRPDGAVRWIENRAYPSQSIEGKIAHAVGVATDITERKQLQEQLQQAQKMDLVGQLAGGIAHDFNNLLTVINGYAGLTLAREDLPADIIKPLQQIQAAGERAANLTRQLLIFSRKQAMQLQPVDLNSGIDDTAKMLGRIIGEHIQLDVILADTLPRVEADKGMIEQVLMNLTVNARDAMPRGGRLLIQTDVREIGEAEARRHAQGRAGRFVCLTVTDTGEGIPPEVMPHIFEPFFTTKKPGEGTGLGLAMAFGIVENHRGWIHVESRVGAGTTFRIFLPVAIPPEARATPPSPASAIAGGSETVLVVEDDAAVRELAGIILRRYGYRVLKAGTGAEAIALWRVENARIDLLLTDMVLPDWNGLELAAKLRAEKPALQVLCASGYNREIDRFSPDHKGVHFLHKPYLPRTLALTVRALLDQEPHPRPGRA